MLRRGRRTPAGRLALCLALSLLAHLLIAVSLGAVIFTVWTPRLEVTWLDLDNTLGAPRPLTAPARQQVAPPARQRPEPSPIPAPRPKKPVAMARAPDAGAPPRDGGPSDGGARDGASRDAVANVPTGAVLTEFAPGDAALMLLLRLDRIRGTGYESAVRRLLEVFYDHKTILWSSGLDPVTDFEALLIATPNPYRVTQTFLAARHRLPLPRIQRALERATRFQTRQLRWRRTAAGLQGEIPSPPKLAQDPRVVLLQQDLVLLTDPTHLGFLATPSPLTTSPDGGGRPPSWSDRLRAMGAHAGNEPDTPGLMVQAINLPRLVQLPADLPPPVSFQLTIAPVDPAPVEATIVFASPRLARAFLADLPHRVQRVKSSFLLRLLGVTDLLDAITYQRRENIVTARTRLSGVQVRGLLEMARGAIPQVRVPGMPERRPPDAGPPAAGGQTVDEPAPARGRRSPDARPPPAVR